MVRSNFHQLWDAASKRGRGGRTGAGASPVAALGIIGQVASRLY